MQIKPSINPEILPTEMCKMFAQWGYKVLDLMEFDDVDSFLELNGVIFRRETITSSEADYGQYVKWGFENILTSRFSQTDWEQFLPLLDEISIDRLTSLALKIDI